MKINITKIEIEGFGSLKSYTHNFYNNGTTIIKGGNGVGKTTIFSALLWVCYGESSKTNSSIGTWPKLQGKDYKGTKVSLTYIDSNGKTQVICRCDSYKDKVNGAKGGNRLMFTDSKESYKKNLQADINKSLGMSPRLFKNSIFFGQKMKRMIEDTGADKKKTLEECFDIGFMEKALKLAKDEIEIISKLKEPIEDAIQDINENIEDQEDLRDHTLEKYKTNYTLYKTKRDSLNELIKVSSKITGGSEKQRKRLNVLNKELETFNAGIHAWGYDLSQNNQDKLTTDIRSLDISKALLNNEMVKLKSKLLKGDGPRTCGSCNQPLKRMNKKDKVLLNQDIHNLEKEIITQDDRIKTITKELENIVGLYYDRKRLATSIEGINIPDDKQTSDKLKDYRNELIRLKEPLEPDVLHIENSISHGNKTLKEQQNKLRKLNNKGKIYQWMVKSPLSNNGLKSYMFELLLEQLNKAMLSYIHIIGFRPEFSVDMDKSNKDIVTTVYDGNDNPVLFEDLSGGQQQLVNIVTAFALHDIVMDIQPFNLLILDEVFEGLDDDNIQKVTELLYIKSSTNSIYLITHQSSFTPTNANIIHLTLNEGLTYQLA